MVQALKVAQATAKGRDKQGWYGKLLQSHEEGDDTYQAVHSLWDNAKVSLV